MDSVDIQKEAQKLIEQYKTVSKLREHGAELIQLYGKETYYDIFRAYQTLRQEQMRIDEELDPARAYSSKEIIEMNVILQLLVKAPDKGVRDQANNLKGKYRTMAGIFAACYPHQMADGRPARKSKNPQTGIQEWHAYKKISFDSVEKIYIECVGNFVGSRGKCSVSIHEEGEPVNTRPKFIAMKPEIKVTLEECQDLIDEAKSTLEMVKDDEEMAYDNLPEGIQMSERGDTMQEGIDALDEAIYSLDDAVSYLNDAVDSVARDLFTEKSPWSGVNVGTTVEHEKFGSGTIISIEGGHITVQFQTKDARFSFPASFEKGYLTIKR